MMSVNQDMNKFCTVAHEQMCMLMYVLLHTNRCVCTDVHVVQLFNRMTGVLCWIILLLSLVSYNLTSPVLCISSVITPV